MRFIRRRCESHPEIRLPYAHYSHPRCFFLGRCPRYPALHKVQFSEVTITVHEFLKLVGTQIRELEVVLTNSKPRTPTNGSHDLLACCPNLETLVLGTKELVSGLGADSGSLLSDGFFF